MSYERVSAISLLLISIFGCCGNALTIIVVNQHFFRRTTSAAFITALSFADFTVLLLQSYQILAKFRLKTATSFDCLIIYFTDVFRLLSVWMIGIMNIERLTLIFNIPHLPRLRSVIKARIFVCFLFCLSLLVFIHYAFFMETHYKYKSEPQILDVSSTVTLLNNTNVTNQSVATYNDSKTTSLMSKKLRTGSVCYFKSEFKSLIWGYIKNSITYWTVTPIVIICNCIIVYRLQEASRIEKSIKPREFQFATTLSTKQKIMTAMLMSSSALFLITSTPATVHLIYMLATKNRSNTQYIIHITTNILLHLHHASNFLVYLSTCQRFRTEIIKLCNTYSRCHTKRNGRHKSTYSAKPETVVRLLSPVKTRRNNYNRGLVTKKRIVVYNVPSHLR
ncbi:unnamed protein product [Didymodactylos carnosus]|uniref:G-protein coupled receptors family 1 profile domain-containing protein n=1 Tax=Didymodactylos carnosus TaxID=1234261 RepID=A0A814HMB8_9BILA|nr:unnamed protein product [Didymodactylos carnosus]CAF1320716.1 unnamed protein product [Didymodactylos carnosus]CAF3783481.1 unnamed protein product [Didymodactylos carnosus]CAF4130661.1 unnamed protein product [Didymodactylos carnosus]